MGDRETYLKFPDPVTHHDTTPMEKKVFSEELAYNAACRCRTRACEHHGFCRACVEKHRKLVESGYGKHGCVCERIKCDGLVLDPDRRA